MSFFRALRWVLPALAAAGVLGMGSGCAPEGQGGDGETGAGSQDIVAGACNVFDVRLNRDMTPDELKKLNDPIAHQVLSGAACPVKLAAIRKAISICPSGKKSAFEAFTVSERSFLLGRPDAQATRAVVARDCGGHNDAFLSVFGVDLAQPTLPQDNTEVVGFDRTAGVFDFYVREEGKWKFMGNSADAVADGYDCDANGACEPKSAQKARCWACHESGSLNMKELHSPWSNWDGGTGNLPGQKAMFTKFGGLHKRGLAPDLETIVEGDNATWAKHRVKVLKNKGTAELLRPLFCTMTMQLETLDKSFLSIPGSLLVTDTMEMDKFGVSAGGPQLDIEIKNGEYAALIKANGQRVVDASGKQLVGKNGPITDSISPLTFPIRGDTDNAYVNELLTQKVVDTDFVNDVLAIDFTRPIFSPERCALADLAPQLAPADMTPQKIRAGFVASLATATGAGARLLAALKDTNPKEHLGTKKKFIAACKARPQKAFVTDILAYNAHLKFAAKAHRTLVPEGNASGFIEFSETFPVDKLPDTPKFFDPATCELK